MTDISKPFIDLGPSAWPNAQSAAKLEWLSTNALGGYAFATVSGALQRRWHGVLIAATDPPAGRTMLVSKVEITVITKGARTEQVLHALEMGQLRPLARLLELVRAAA